MFGYAVDQTVEKAAEKTFGLRAVKTLHDHTSAVGDDGREAFGLMPAGDPHVFVGINLRQHKFPAITADQAPQQGREHAAGAAPFGADVEHDRHLVRAGQHQRIKIGFYNIVREIHGLRIFS